MSSTRVANRKEKQVDFYPTPISVTKGLLPFLEVVPSNFLEPCAGNGKIIEAVKSHYPNCVASAIEIQNGFKDDLLQLTDDVVIADFLTMKAMPQYSLIITNPPFSQAMEFVKAAYEWLGPNGQMAFLLRLPFVASVKRYNFLKTLKPSKILVLSQRPKFSGTNIDSCDYAWFIWNKNEATKQTILDWIPPC